MFSDEETINYEKDFNQIGVTKLEEQKKVLEFFYTLGKITYKFNIAYDKEES